MSSNWPSEEERARVNYVNLGKLDCLKEKMDTFKYDNYKVDLTKSLEKVSGKYMRKGRFRLLREGVCFLSINFLQIICGRGINKNSIDIKKQQRNICKKSRIRILDSVKQTRSGIMCV